MIRIFIIIFIILSVNLDVFAQNNIYSEEYLQKCKDYIIRKERFNAINYNALQLSPEQIDKYEDITESNENSYKEKLNQIVQELQKYYVMKKSNLPADEIREQKRCIRKLYREMSRISHQENRKLKKILNRNQRRNYNMVKHLERHDIKKDLHPKDYHKLNPKMTVFGNLKD